MATETHDVCSYCRAAGVGSLKAHKAISLEFSLDNSLEKEVEFNQDEYDNFDEEKQTEEFKGVNIEELDKTSAIPYKDESYQPPKNIALDQDKIAEMVKNLPVDDDDYDHYSDEIDNEEPQAVLVASEERAQEDSEEVLKPKEPKQKQPTGRPRGRPKKISEHQQDAVKSVKEIERKESVNKTKESVSRLAAQAVPPSAVALGAGEAALNVVSKTAQGTFGAVKRVAVGGMELVSSSWDIATTTGRLSIAAFSLPFVILKTGLAFGLKSKIPLAGAKSVMRGFGQMFNTIRYGLQPLFDGRAVPFVGVASTVAAAVSSSAIAASASPAIAGLSFSVGPTILASYVAYRTVKGIITGERTVSNAAVGRWSGFSWKKINASDTLRNAYKNTRWVDTTKLSSKQVRSLDHEFERTVALALSEMGFAAQVHGTQGDRADGRTGPGDGGIDVTIIDAAGSRTVVSCKRYAGKVGEKEVRDIFAVSKSSQFNGSRPMLVTTTGFTGPAIHFASKNGIILATLDQLIEKASEYKY